MNNKKEEKMFYKKIGDKIKKRRMECGVTQEELEVKTGINQNAISRIERGGNISFFKITKIMDFLGIEI